jgi:hypothetical protein
MVLACCHWLSESECHKRFPVLQDLDSGVSDREFICRVTCVVFRQQRVNEGAGLSGCARGRELLWMGPQPHCCGIELWPAITLIVCIFVSGPCTQKCNWCFNISFQRQHQGSACWELLFEHKLEPTCPHGAQRVRRHSMAERYLVDLHSIAFTREHSQFCVDC